MSAVTGISWTDRTWNPVVGCTKVSQGCKHCYAKTLHDLRHKAFLAGKLQNIPQYSDPFETVQLLHDRLSDPLGWGRQSRVFVNSMSDLFHDDVPDLFIVSVFAVMALAPRHSFQILTKRPARARELLSDSAFAHRVSVVVAQWSQIPQLRRKPTIAWRASLALANGFGVKWGTTWPLPNVWLGVSVENQPAANERIPLLVQTPAAVRFLSCEPLLGPIDFYEAGSRGGEDGDPFEFSALRGTDGTDPSIPGIDWVIVGGESGKGARPMHPEWARSIRDQCAAAGVAFHFKQWGNYAPMGHCDASNVEGPDGEHGFVMDPPGPWGRAYMWGTRKWLKMIGRELDGRTWDEFPAVQA